MSGFDSYRLRERAEIARLVLIGAFLVLAGAFFRTQVIQHDKFQLKAETNRLRPIPLTPPRGSILDRNGRVLAENVPGYSVKLLASSTDSLRAVLDRVRRYVPLDKTQTQDIIERYKRARYQPALVFGDASFDVIAKLEEHRADIPGLVIQAEPKRLYPAGKAVAHLVGYVSEVTEADLTADRYPGAVLGSLVGKAGLEREYDDTLRGGEGVRYIEVNARGRLVREGAASALPPTPGKPILTTVDLDLQRFVDSIWPSGMRGALVAMTPRGEVRALYSAPNFDPNSFVGGISSAEWRKLNNDPAKPLLNRVIQARYPPASPFKLAVGAMALKRGLIRLSTHMPEPCRGGMRLGNRIFRCWKREGHGSVDLTGAVAVSCDVYFYQLGLRLGLDAIIQDGVLMGFRDKSGIDLENELSPIYPSSTAYFDKLYGPRHWSPPGTTLNFSIGQGENTQTLINMMRFYQGLASSNGEAVTPYIVRPSSNRKRSLGLSQKELDGLRHSLIAVVERGTAMASRRTDLTVAGKTGTAQNPHGADHGWFIGFAPADKPELIVGGIMEFAEHGTTVAPYVVRTLRRYILGPEAVGPIKLGVLQDEQASGGDNVSAPIELITDSTVTSPSGADTLIIQPGTEP